MSDILEFVHGIMEDTSDVERVTPNTVTDQKSDAAAWNTLTLLSEQSKRNSQTDNRNYTADNKWFDATGFGDIVIKKEIDSASNSSWLGYVILMLTNLIVCCCLVYVMRLLFYYLCLFQICYTICLQLMLLAKMSMVVGGGSGLEQYLHVRDMVVLK